jgi:phosphotransferase system enzyme I (PtsP)
VQSDTRARMMHMTDPYLRERMHDFDDLANRLLRQLAGAARHARDALPKDAIVVARAMGAAELLDYPRAKLRGLVLEEGASPATWSSSRAPWAFRSSANAKGAVAMAENGDADHHRRRGRQGASAPAAPMSQRAYAEKVRFRARRQEQYPGAARRAL